jgi:transcriptional regulator with XRE-family HTH domain
MALRNQEIGARLRELRGQKPQTTVADELGVSERAYQGWEGGEAKPSYRNLQRLAAYFNVGEDFILTGERRGSVPPASGTPVLAARRESGEDRLARMEQEIAGLIAAVSDVITEAREVIDDFKTYRSEISGQLTGQTGILEADRGEARPGRAGGRQDRGG